MVVRYTGLSLEEQSRLQIKIGSCQEQIVFKTKRSEGEGVDGRREAH